MPSRDSVGRRSMRLSSPEVRPPLDATRVWLVQMAEPLPYVGEHGRKMRTALLAEYLASRGATVTWWTSSLDHESKRLRTGDGLNPLPGLSVRLLRALPYSKNVSLRRLVNNSLIALRLLRAGLEVSDRPDVIVSSLPDVEASLAASHLAHRFGCPFVIDVRDPYPDYFLLALPPMWRSAGALALWPWRSMLRRTLASADVVVAISDAMLSWAKGYRPRGPGKAWRAIPIGFELSDAHPAAERLSPGPWTIWFVGSMNSIIDLETPIVGLRSLPTEVGSKFRLVLSGAGDKLPRWQECARGMSNVVFTGPVFDGEFERHAADADFGLAPYVPGTPSGWRNKHADYLSRGLPVLSSLDGEVARSLAAHQSGLSFAAGSPQSFATMLKRIAHSSALPLDAPKRAMKLAGELSSSRVNREFEFVLAEAIGQTSR